MVEALTPMFVHCCYPFSLKSDNAPQFVSEEVEEFIPRMVLSIANLHANVEFEWQILLKALKIAQVEGKEVER